MSNRYQVSQLTVTLENGDVLPARVTVGDIVNLEHREIVALLYKRLNRDRAPGAIIGIERCQPLAEQVVEQAHLEDLQRFEEKMLSYEADPIAICNDNHNFDLIGMLTSTGQCEDEAQMDSIYEGIFTEGSHGELKKVYRIGFDVNAGMRVAVQFSLDSSKTTGVGDEQLTRNTIAYGHIDHRMEALGVESIFTKDHQPLMKVTLIGLFSKQVLSIIKTLRQKEPYCSIQRVDALLDDPTFCEELASKIQEDSGIMENVEEYQLGLVGGYNKYKTTTLIWKYRDFDHFSLQY